MTGGQSGTVRAAWRRAWRRAQPALAGSVAPGATVTVGFTGAYTSSDAPPTAVACT